MSSAGTRWFLKEGTIMFSYSLGIDSLKMVFSLEMFLIWTFCSYCLPMHASYNFISVDLQIQLLSGTIPEHFKSIVFPFFSLSFRIYYTFPYPSD